MEKIRQMLEDSKLKTKKLNQVGSHFIALHWGHTTVMGKYEETKILKENP